MTIEGLDLIFLGNIKEGVFYYLNIMMIIRFFRTDFASLLKRYLIVDGFGIVVILIFFYCVNLLVRTFRQQKLMNY